MLGLFKKNKGNEILIATPIRGKVLDITEVPDLVFSQKMVGDGVAIEPSEGRVTSPIDGEVIQVMDTKHALGLKSKEGIEILVHIGIDTVGMKGEGFEVYVAAGDKVMQGDALMSFDLEKVKGGAKSIISPIVITNFEEVKKLEKSLGEAKEWIMKAVLER